MTGTPALIRGILTILNLLEILPVYLVESADLPVAVICNQGSCPFLKIKFKDLSKTFKDHMNDKEN